MTYRFTAFLKDPDADRPDNPIHSTAGGQQHGFKSALVGGVHVFGWTTGAFLESLGDQWLESGWVEISFRRPVYDGDVMTVNLAGESFTVTNPAADVCLEGRAGLGSPPFQIEPIEFAAPEPQPADRPRLTLDSAPVGQTLRSMGVSWHSTDQEPFVEQWLEDANPRYHGTQPDCHPAWIARQPIDLLHHSFDYGPAIHTDSQIQYLAPARVGDEFVIAGRCADAFDKRGHHFIVNECALFGSDEQELVRLRHTAIFKLRTAD